MQILSIGEKASAEGGEKASAEGGEKASAEGMVNL